MSAETTSRRLYKALHLDDDETRRELQRLLDDDERINRLTYYAEWQAKKTKYGPTAADDLVQEAFERFWSGSRKIAPEKTLDSVLRGAIRSIANDWMEPWNRKRGKSDPEFQKGASDRVGGTPDKDPTTNSTPEKDLITKNEAEMLLAFFADRPLAQQILQIIIDRGTKEQAIEELDISDIEYDNERTLIRRRLCKYRREFAG